MKVAVVAVVEEPVVAPLAVQPVERKEVDIFELEKGERFFDLLAEFLRGIFRVDLGLDEYILPFAESRVEELLERYAHLQLATSVTSRRLEVVDAE